MRRRLAAMGLRPVHRRALEDNFLFDTTERALRGVRSILRLRHYAAQWVLTYKGTPEPDAFFKSRVELECTVSNAATMRAIFEELGYGPVFRYQKYRTVYAPEHRSRTAHFEIALDETPVGNFLEIEGSRSAIDRAAKALGYSRADYLTASYGALYLEDCARKKVTPGDMVFSAASATVPWQQL
jgi:adenylate cyclase, class 2